MKLIIHPKFPGSVLARPKLRCLVREHNFEMLKKFLLINKIAFKYERKQWFILIITKSKREVRVFVIYIRKKYLYLFSLFLKFICNFLQFCQYTIASVFYALHMSCFNNKRCQIYSTSLKKTKRESFLSVNSFNCFFNGNILS